MLQILHPPLKQFLVFKGVPKIIYKLPLYPVATILLFFTIMDPTASFMHPDLDLRALQTYKKYSSQVGLNGGIICL